MNKQLEEFERFLARKSTEACRVLCMPYSTYAGYRNQDKPLSSFVSGHIETLKRLEPGALNELVRERLSRAATA